MHSEPLILLESLIAFSHSVLMLFALVAMLDTLYLGILVGKTRSANVDIRKQLIKQKYDQRHFQIGSLPLWCE